jgi:hypothetical protein
MGTAPVVPEIKQERTVLKKAGIVVAAAAAGLLAVSPLAFAGESHGKGHGHSHGAADVNSYQENSEGLVNVSDINANVPVNALNCDEVDLGLVPIDVKQVTAPITGALALFGSVETEQTTLTDNSCSTNQTSAVDTSSQAND